MPPSQTGCRSRVVGDKHGGQVDGFEELAANTRNRAAPASISKKPTLAAQFPSLSLEVGKVSLLRAFDTRGGVRGVNVPMKSWIAFGVRLNSRSVSVHLACSPPCRESDGRELVRRSNGVRANRLPSVEMDDRSAASSDALRLVRLRRTDDVVTCVVEWGWNLVMVRQPNRVWARPCRRWPNSQTYEPLFSPMILLFRVSSTILASCDVVSSGQTVALLVDDNAGVVRVPVVGDDPPAAGLLHKLDVSARHVAAAGISHDSSCMLNDRTSPRSLWQQCQGSHPASCRSDPAASARRSSSSGRDLPPVVLCVLLRCGDCTVMLHPTRQVEGSLVADELRCVSDPPSSSRLRSNSSAVTERAADATSPADF